MALIRQGRNWRYADLVRRSFGAIAFLAGAAFVAMAIYAWLSTESMSSKAPMSAMEFDLDAWRTRWKLWSAIAILIGSFTAIGGGAIILRRSWGFLLISLAAVLFGVFPWCLKALDLTKYAFELPRVLETAVCLAIAVSMILAFATWTTDRRERADATVFSKVRRAEPRS